MTTVVLAVPMVPQIRTTHHRPQALYKVRPPLAPREVHIQTTPFLTVYPVAHLRTTPWARIIVPKTIIISRGQVNRLDGHLAMEEPLGARRLSGKKTLIMA